MQSTYETLGEVVDGLTAIPDGPRGVVALAAEFMLAASSDPDNTEGMRTAMCALGWSLHRVGEAMDAMGEAVGGFSMAGKGARDGLGLARKDAEPVRAG